MILSLQIICHWMFCSVHAQINKYSTPSIYVTRPCLPFVFIFILVVSLLQIHWPSLEVKPLRLWRNLWTAIFTLKFWTPKCFPFVSVQLLTAVLQRLNKFETKQIKTEIVGQKKIVFQNTQWKPLSRLFKLIYDQKIVPAQWKMAKIIPTHKKVPRMMWHTIALSLTSVKFPKFMKNSS